MDEERGTRTGANRPEEATKGTAPDARRALELWWLGCGGRLPSPLMGNRMPGEGGPDHAYLVSLHLERFFAERHPGWRALAKWATANGFRMETYPAWLVTPSRLFSLAQGQLITLAPQMRGFGLLLALLKDLSRWIGENPLPEEKPEWMVE